MAWWSWLLVQLLVWGCPLAVVVVSWLCWLWATRPHVDAPGPPTLPIIGNMLDLYQAPVLVNKVRDFHRQYGDLARFYVGPVLVVMVAHPDDVQHVLVKSRQVDRDPYTRHVFQIIFGSSVLTLNGQQWKAHRKLVTPTFHSELLRGFLEAFHEGGLFLSERLARSRGAATALHPPVLLATLRAVCNSLFGIDPHQMIPDALAEEEIAAAIRNAVAIIQKLLVQPWRKWKALLPLTSQGRSVLQYLRLLRAQVMKSVAMRAAATEGAAAASRPCLLEALVRPGGQTALPLTEVRDEMVTLTIGGVETSSMTVGYALALLALHPEWQDAAQRELREVFGEGDDYLRAPTLTDLHSLKVLEGIIKETLRLFPTVPVIPRITKEDLQLSGDRVLVPKGTVLAVMPCLTHRLPQFFSDPLRFDPARFLEGRSDKETVGSYLPFGLGPRNCVGAQYGRLQVKVLLAAVLRRFRLLPHSRREDLEEGVLSITLQTVKPIKVRCLPLQGPSP